MASNLGGGQHGHLSLTMTTEDYLTQLGHVFVPPHNPTIAPRKWVPPKNKRSGPKGSWKTEHSSDAALP